jgi:hypothetical protein
MGKVTTFKIIPANDRKDNGATVVWGGNATTTGYTPAVTNVPDTLVTTHKPGPHGSKVPGPESAVKIAHGTDTKGTFKPYAAGDFATMQAGEYLIRLYSHYIAGVANTLLSSPANLSGFYRGIHRKENRRHTKILSWDYATGAATKGTPVNIQFGDDHASRPTMAIPGELSYAFAPLPVNDDYQPRTQW